MLGELKLLFTEFPTFLNPDATTPTRPQEIMLVRETMEHAVLQAATNKDVQEFQRHFEILRTYYNDFTDGPQSERRLLILGLHLLRLLATSETRTFHMELERIKVADQESMYIKVFILIFFIFFCVCVKYKKKKKKKITTKKTGRNPTRKIPHGRFLS